MYVGREGVELIKQFFINVNWNEVDLLVVDTPPGTTDEHLALAKYLKPCFEESSGLGVLVVTTPHALSIQDVRRQLEFCRKVGLKVWGIIENMAGFTCPKCQVILSLVNSRLPGNKKRSKLWCSSLTKKKEALNSWPKISMCRSWDKYLWILA